MFARARGLIRRCTLHFRYDNTATLFVRVFGETVAAQGAALKTAMTTTSSALTMVVMMLRAISPLVMVVVRPMVEAPSPVRAPASCGDYDQMPHHRACFKDSGGSSRRHASVKREEGSG